jgi:hypothetical protein
MRFDEGELEPGIQKAEMVQIVDHRTLEVGAGQILEIALREMK